MNIDTLPQYIGIYLILAHVLLFLVVVKDWNVIIMCSLN